MYTQVDIAGTRNNRARRRKQRRRRIRTGILLLIGFVCIVGLYKVITRNERVDEYMRKKGAYENIDISKEITKGEIPLFLQYDKRWGQAIYGDGMMSETGCGPTSLSMVYSGLTGDDTWNPYKLACKAEMEGYYADGSGSLWSMMTELAEELRLYAYEVRFDKESILAELQAGNPIICIMGPGDFTTTGHFIVLAGIADDGSIIVRDPNSEANSEKTWELEELMSQMRNLWGYKAD